MPSAARIVLLGAGSLLVVTAIFSRSPEWVAAADRTLDFHLGGPWVWAWWSVGVASIVAGFAIRSDPATGRVAVLLGFLWTAAALAAAALPSLGGGAGDSLAGLLVGAALLVAGWASRGPRPAGASVTPRA